MAKGKPKGRSKKKAGAIRTRIVKVYRRMGRKSKTATISVGATVGGLILLRTMLPKAWAQAGVDATEFSMSTVSAWGPAGRIQRLGGVAFGDVVDITKDPVGRGIAIGATLVTIGWLTNMVRKMHLPSARLPLIGTRIKAA